VLQRSKSPVIKNILLAFRPIPKKKEKTRIKIKTVVLEGHAENNPKLQMTKGGCKVTHENKPK